MKAVFCTIETKSEDWVLDARATYLKKIKPMLPLDFEAVRSPPLERQDQEAKKRHEADKILKVLKATDRVILFDENGTTFANSEAFARVLGQNLERSPTRLVFLVGGAFGVDSAVRERANLVWSLGALTFNHWIAQIVALEQIYRGLTILRGIPYHNR